MFTVRHSKTLFSLSWIIPVVMLMVPLLGVGYLAGMQYTRDTLTSGVGALHDLTVEGVTTASATQDAAPSEPLCASDVRDC